jgi:cytochrome c oxidase assembly factor 3
VSIRSFRPPSLPAHHALTYSYRLKRSSYYTPEYTQSAALIRARRPYILKNAIMGVAIMTFAIGVFTFTLKAVGQDDFSDVIVPEGREIQIQQPAKTPNVQTNGVR